MCSKTENQKVNSKAFTDLVTDTFGPSLAQNIRHEDGIVELHQVRVINERTIHPLIDPIYRTLVKHRLTVRSWVLIFHRILLCRNSYKRSIERVYKAIYETLTNTVTIGETIFEVLPIEEKRLWYNLYTIDYVDLLDREKCIELTRFCLEQAHDIETYCKDVLRISIPKVDKSQIYRELNLMELAVKRAAGKKAQANKNNTEPLSLQEEIFQLEEFLEESFKEITELNNKLVASQNTKSTDNTKFKGTSKPQTTSTPVDDTSTCKNPQIARKICYSKASAPEHDPSIPEYDPSVFKNEPSDMNRDESLLNDKCEPVLHKNITVRQKTYQQSTDKSSVPKYPTASNFVDRPKPNLTMNYREKSQVRVIDFLPKKYNPVHPECDAESHFLAFRDYLSSQTTPERLDEEDVLEVFKFTLGGEARMWFQAHFPFESLDHMEQMFLKEYAPDLKSTTTAAKAFADLKYDPKTRISILINKILRLNRTLNYNDEVLRDRFMTAMPSNVRQLAKINNPITFKQCIDAVKTILEDSPINESVSMISSDDSIGELTMNFRSMQKDIKSIAKQVGNNQPRNSTNGFNKNFQGRPQYRQDGRTDQRMFRPPPATPRYQQGQQWQMVRQGQVNNPKGNLRCFNCNRLGHFQFECRFPPMRPQNRGPPQNFQNPHQNFQRPSQNFQGPPQNFQSSQNRYQQPYQGRYQQNFQGRPGRYQGYQGPNRYQQGDQNRPNQI